MIGREDLADLTATEVAQRVGNGSLSAVKVVEAALDGP
jgi:hypothetical protein